MKLWVGVVSLFLGSIAAFGQNGKARDSHSGPLSYAESKRNEEAFMDHVRPIFVSKNHAGRISYAGQCAVSGSEFVYFPQIELDSLDQGKVRATPDSFIEDNGVTVSSPPDRMISIVIGNPSMAILKVRIPAFSLASMGQYNPGLAIGSLLSTPEVTTEMERLNIRVPLSLSNELLTKPKNGLPHLPNVIKDKTVDEILNFVALTFKGVVVYGICSESAGESRLTVDFVGLH